jgi:tellurite resistance protein
MVLMSAADSDMTDRELHTMGEMVRILPVFRDFNPDLLPKLSEDCAEILSQKDGLDAVIKIIADSLPPKLRETAYPLACDIAATDGMLAAEEIKLLEFMRHPLDVDRLTAAAIERGARARHATL